MYKFYYIKIYQEGAIMRSALTELPAIRPITDLRTHLNDVCTQATESRKPIVLTKNGSASYVLLDSDAYEEVERDNRIYLALKEAEIEERYNPDTISEEESNVKMKEIFALWGLEYA